MPQRLYAQLGRRDAALRQRKTCVDVLHRDLGVEPRGGDEAALPRHPPRALGDSLILCGYQSAVGSPREAWGSRSNLELRSAGRSLPTPQISASSPWLPLAGSEM